MTLWLVCFIVPLLFGLWAQMKVKRAYGKYSQVGNSAGMTGAQAAAQMLRGQGLQIVGSAEEAQSTENAVAVESVRGFLSDHYDPRHKVLRLSPDVYSGRSLAAVGIACHEAGHALQDAHGYAPLAVRSTLVPVVSIGSYAAFPIIIIGMLMASAELLLLGIFAFAGITIFQFITLPVEFNASTRAKQALVQLGITGGREEEAGVAHVLDAAALTYVAAFVSSSMTLLYYVLMFTGMARD